MSGALRSVYERERTHRVRFLAKFSHRINCAQRIGNMGERKKLHLWCEQGRKLLQLERPIIANWQKSELRAGSLRQQLPRYQIAVMLHYRQQDHISFANEFSAPCLGYKIDALGGSAREHDFVCTRRADVVCNPLPCFFVSFRGARAQHM